MAASKLAVYDSGYDDERFEQNVSQTLHCIICTNVIKDPVMCRHNEHIFCRGCITRHLVNSQTCPTCIEPLTVDTLIQAPRGIRNLLAELKIRCEFFDRGCGKFVELGYLKKHVANCGFAPAVCPNQGCQLEVNKQDLFHHETAVCEMRGVKCHSCDDIRKEMDTIKVKLASIDGKLERNKKYSEKVVENIKRSDAKVQDHVTKQEKSISRLEADSVEMKKSLIEISKQLERILGQTSRNNFSEQAKKRIAESGVMDREPKVIIAGGANGPLGILKSVEMFSLANETWTLLQPMRECRSGASSVVYNGQLFVSGGWGNLSKSMETLNVVHVDQAITWEKSAEIPEVLCGHSIVVYDGRLIVIGGWKNSSMASSGTVTEISPVSSCPSKVLFTMPLVRCYHSAALFGDKILVFGGRKVSWICEALMSVVMYDISKNEFQKLAPLPYPVSQMATVKWGEDNVMIMGGADSNDKALSTALLYNIKTQKSHMLPDMKHKRKGCEAVIVRDTVIVMGGQDGRNYLKSVESFRFDRYSWQELREMHEARWQATAAVCH